MGTISITKIWLNCSSVAGLKQPRWADRLTDNTTNMWKETLAHVQVSMEFQGVSQTHNPYTHTYVHICMCICWARVIHVIICRSLNKPNDRYIDLYRRTADDYPGRRQPMLMWRCFPCICIFCDSVASNQPSNRLTNQWQTFLQHSNAFNCATKQASVPTTTITTTTTPTTIFYLATTAKGNVGYCFTNEVSIARLKYLTYHAILGVVSVVIVIVVVVAVVIAIVMMRMLLSSLLLWLCGIASEEKTHNITKVYQPPKMPLL